jgi:hypothetical protein
VKRSANAPIIEVIPSYGNPVLQLTESPHGASVSEWMNIHLGSTSPLPEALSALLIQVSSTRSVSDQNVPATERIRPE